MNELIFVLLAAGQEPIRPPSPSPGKWFFVGALALLLVWLICMPRRLIGQTEGALPWWRNVRLWAMVVATIQMLVYIWYA